MKPLSIFALAVAPLVLLAAPSSAGTRNYDCTKAGNANKTTCKTSAPKPAAKPKVAAATPPKTRNYDCSKPGNANKAACKTASKSASPTMQPRPHSVAAPASAVGPQGVTAKCRDNTYSKSKDHRGACSHHGGVATWY